MIAMLAIPRRTDARARPLRSSRILLTPLDGAVSRELWASVEANRAHLEPWLPWVPFTSDADATLRYADASGEDWDAARALRFAVRVGPDNESRFVGVAGLENLSHLHRTGDLGYWLREDATGNGYMTEACMLLLDWAFRTVGFHRIRVAASTENAASLSVIRRLGFQFEGVARQAEFCRAR